MKKWLSAQPHQPSSIAELQALLDVFVEYYNYCRPHRSLPGRSTPAAAYAARPKATPGTKVADPHDRVRRDRIDDSGSITLRVHGRLHHIGIGRTHPRTHVVLLVHDLHVRVVDAATGELQRDLIVDPTRDYQPTGSPRGPTRRKKSRFARVRTFPMSREITLTDRTSCWPACRPRPRPARLGASRVVPSG
jgi:hypothetical protein